jgi:hypothetical protein
MHQGGEESGSGDPKTGKSHELFCRGDQSLYKERAVTEIRNFSVGVTRSREKNKRNPVHFCSTCTLLKMQKGG